MTTIRDTSAQPDRRSGFSLVELVVAITLFSLVVLGMIQMAMVSRTLTRAGELKTRAWSVASQQMEQLRLTPFDDLTSGSDSVQGYPVSWAVTGTEPKTVTLLIERPDVLETSAVDTFVMHVSDWGSQ